TTSRYDSLIDYDNLASLTLHGGSSHNLFTVSSTPAATPVTITAGNANDTVNVGDPLQLLQDVNTLTVHGGTGTSLILDDQSNQPVSREGAREFGTDIRVTSPNYQITDRDVVRTDEVI